MPNLTVAATPRTYTRSYDARYAKESAAGNTQIYKVSITDGSSILRISHDDKKGVERHYISLEDVTPDAVNPATSNVKKVGVTLTCKKDSIIDEQALKALLAGLIAYLTDDGVKNAVLAGALELPNAA